MELLTTNFWVGTVWPIVLLAIGLSAVIFVHELGHFLAAKWMGIRVDVFSLGFGPRILGLKRGETDYRISLLPLGGYVKMLGQDDLRPQDTARTDPRSFLHKTVGQRAIVVSAGVLMNLLFSVVIFAVVFMVGVPFAPAVIGYVELDKPADKAGLRPGDRIVKIDGAEAPDFNDIPIATALSSRGQSIDVVYQRPGQKGTRHVTIEPEWSERGEMRQIGVGPASSLIVLSDHRKSELNDYPQLQAGDRLVAVNDKKITDYPQFEAELMGLRGRKAVLHFERKNRKGEITPIEAPLKSMFAGNVLGLGPVIKLDKISQESPAKKAGYQPGDVLARCCDTRFPDADETRGFIIKSKGHPVPIEVIRNGQKIYLPVAPERSFFQPVYKLGIVMTDAYDTPYISPKVEKDSLAAKQKVHIPPGAIMKRLNGHPVNNWTELISAVEKNPGLPGVLDIEVEGKSRTIHLGTLPTPAEWKQSRTFRFSTSIAFRPLTEIRRSTNPLGAVRLGLKKTGTFVQQVYVTLLRLFEGTVKTKHLAGPVGIVRISYSAFEEGWTKLFYFLAVISVNLAVINFLPIPVVDGGLMVFLLIEKIKGSPVGVKLQTATQLVGLLLIAALFLIVTYNDLVRIFSS